MYRKIYIEIKPNHMINNAKIGNLGKPFQDVKNHVLLTNSLQNV